jgi:hypothetical protein
MSKMELDAWCKSDCKTCTDNSVRRTWDWWLRSQTPFQRAPVLASQAKATRYQGQESLLYVGACPISYAYVIHHDHDSQNRPSDGSYECSSTDANSNGKSALNTSTIAWAIEGPSDNPTSNTFEHTCSSRYFPYFHACGKNITIQMMTRPVRRTKCVVRCIKHLHF